jgi:hypothetical protein
VILEPDALAGLDCLTQQDRDARLALLNDAVSVLQTKAVYLDAGHSAWQPAATMGAPPPAGRHPERHRLLAQRLELPVHRRRARLWPRARPATHHRHG